MDEHSVHAWWLHHRSGDVLLLPFLAGAAAADGRACKNVLPVARLKAEESDLLLPRVGADEKLMRLQRVIAVSTKTRA